MTDFPGNSYTSKIVPPKPVESAATEDTPKKEAEKKPIAEGKIRPKSIGARFKDIFFTETAGFGDYLLKEVIIPGARDVFFGAIEHTLNGFKQGIERQIYGENHTRSKTSYGTGRPIKINYNGMSSRSASTRPPVGGRTVRRFAMDNRRSNVVQDFTLESRAACEEVLQHLELLVDRQGHCTVGDLYSAVDIRPKSTDESWGWVDVTNAVINRRGPNEYIITLPDPDPIESEDI